MTYYIVAPFDMSETLSMADFRFAHRVVRERLYPQFPVDDNWIVYSDLLYGQYCKFTIFKYQKRFSDSNYYICALNITKAEEIMFGTRYDDLIIEGENGDNQTKIISTIDTKRYRQFKLSRI